MALLCNIIIKGFEIKDCYIKAEAFSGNKADVVFSASHKKDSAADILFTREFQFTYNLSGGNVLEQAYAYLKTLPEFAGAVDC